MKATIKSRSVTMIAALAILAAGGGAHPAYAQTQKGQAPPQLVRDIDEPGRNPFQTSQNVTFGTVSFTASLLVPAGKVAVIEHVSTSGALAGTGIVQAFVRCLNGTQEVNHSLVLTPQGTNPVNGFTQYAASQPIKCYATSGEHDLSIHVQTGTFQDAQPIWVAAASGYVLNQ